MKTEKEVKKMLKGSEKEYKETLARFDRYDNHDDLDRLGEIRAEISVLKQVLGPN
jgi:hypothetical protein